MGKSQKLSDLTFQTNSTSVTAANGSATTLFSLSSNTFATYIVTAGLAAGDPANYHEVAIISQQGSTLQATNLVNGSLMSISVSGLNIQATQSSGATSTIVGRLTCLTRT